MLDSLSYVRAPLATLVILIFTLIQSVTVIVTSFLTRSLRVIDFVMVNLWAKPVLALGGVTFEIRGADRVDKTGKGFLLLFNHSSHMDIPVIFCFPRSFRFGAKIELFKIPFFGRAMRNVGVLPIDRGNRSKVMKVYEGAIERVAKGECFALAPEGTRQPEPKIGPFKRGPFEFALNARMDIVPVVLAGAYEVLPKDGFVVNLGKWRRKVIMEILPKVSTETYTMETIEELMNLVRERMSETFERNHRELYGPASAPTPLS